MHMMSSEDLKKVAKKILRRQQGLHDAQIMHPARDWLVGVLVAIVVVLGTSAVSVTKYLENKDLEIIEVDQSQIKTTNYRDNYIKEALAVFENKERVRDEIIGVFEQPVVEEVSTTTDVIAENASTTEPVTEEGDEDEGVEVDVEAEITASTTDVQ